MSSRHVLTEGEGRSPSPPKQGFSAMANLLFVSSSLFGDASQSRTIAQEFVDRWVRTHPGTKLVNRALSADTIPHLTWAPFKAAATPADQRNAAENESAALADALIQEIEAADTVVIAA